MLHGAPWRRLVILSSVVALALAGACGFPAPLAQGGDDDAGGDGSTDDGGDDGGSDGPQAVSVGFASDMTPADEAAGIVPVTVALSAPASAMVSVHFGVTGGSADPAMDYTLANPTDTLVFAPGETTKTILVMIKPDSVVELDETVMLTLDSPMGATLGTVPTNTITISANALPRVTLLAMMTSASEGGGAVSVAVNLDSQSTSTVTVDYTIGGTATGADLALASGTLTFLPGEVTKQLALGVVDDALDENDETVVVTLQNPTNAIVGAIPTQTHTILDNDDAPNVQFSVGAATVVESTPSITLTVVLSAASGLTVTVPFARAGGSTATSPSDFTYGTASPLVFSPGTTSLPIIVNLQNDTTAESGERVLTTLSGPTNATVGTIGTHTLSISDDDGICVGRGTYQVCLQTIPTGTVSLGATLDTSPGGDVRCLATQPTGWTAAGQPDACFIVGNSISVSAALDVRGSRPLVLVAATSITVSSTLDVASHIAGKTGPGAQTGTCNAGTPPPANTSGAGGGAGGGFGSTGAMGGTGDGGAGAAGVAGAPAGAPSVLRGGCRGQRGGDGNTANVMGTPGEGGGSLYLVAGTSITVSGTINASGAGAVHGDHFAGGSGGGSGGMIKLDAPSIMVTGATILANGGGASAGQDNNSSTGDGGDPIAATAAVPALGGVATGGGGTGGTGFAGSTQAVDGADGSGSKGGGGGGGGGGYVQSPVALTGAFVSAGLLQAP